MISCKKNLSTAKKKTEKLKIKKQIFKIKYLKSGREHYRHAGGGIFDYIDLCFFFIILLDKIAPLIVIIAQLNNATAYKIKIFDWLIK